MTEPTMNFADAGRIREFFAERMERIRAHRRELHAIPELGFAEHLTSAYIRRNLEAMDIPYVADIGGTGIVARLGGKGPRVAIRADMDALPLVEAGDRPYASRHAGVMHACGHDAHMAILLGVAEYLKSIETSLPGEMLLVFQPAEERSDGKGLTGARYVIQSGLLEGARAVIGLHVMSDGPAGKFGIAAGPIMASGDMFRAVIHGRGGHDAFVHRTVDPIFLATQVLNAVYAIRSRKVSPTAWGTISVGTVEAGTTANVIPERVDISGAIRTFDDETREIFVDGLERALKIAETLGGGYELDMPFHVPPTRNDAALAELARLAAIELFGEAGLYDFKPSMTVEDFSWYAERYPSLFVVLGAKLDDGVERSHHNPLFDIDDGILYRGGALLAMTALRIAASGPRG